MSSSSATQGHYLVAASGQSVYIRVVGLASMNNCGPLEKFLDEFRSRGGCTQYIFDFSECFGFDSTFMGLLIGFALRGQHDPGEASDRVGETESQGAGRNSEVVVVNASDGHRQQLRSVGVDRVVDLCLQPVSFPPIRLTRLADAMQSVDQHLRRMVRAHESLIEVDSRNRERFGAFLDMVRKELESGA